jgi:hypothetical protein
MPGTGQDSGKTKGLKTGQCQRKNLGYADLAVGIQVKLEYYGKN